MKLKYLISCALSLVFSPLSTAHATDFSYKNLILASVKLSPAFDYGTYVDSLMQVFYPAAWQKSHNDEFELHAKRDETIENVKKAAKDLNLDDPIILHSGFEFGEYDFDNKEFAFSPIGASTYFSQLGDNTQLPREYKLYFENADIIDGIPMDASAAKAFIDKRKNGGFINRRVNVDIYAKITSLRSETEFSSQIVKVIVRDATNGNRVLLTWPKASP